MCRRGSEGGGGGGAITVAEWRGELQHSPPPSTPPEIAGQSPQTLTSSPPHSACVQLLAVWLARLPVELFGGRIIRPLQRYLTGLASQVWVVGGRGDLGGQAPPPDIIRPLQRNLTGLASQVRAVGGEGRGVSLSIRPPRHRDVHVSLTLSVMPPGPGLPLCRVELSTPPPPPLTPCLSPPPPSRVSTPVV